MMVQASHHQDHLGSKEGLGSNSTLKSGTTASSEGNIELDECDLGWSEHIGAGHTCDVFKGTFRGQEVAIKHFKYGFGGGQFMSESLVREVSVMCLITHPNIVMLHGVITRSCPAKIVMEFCSGGTLFELVHRRKDLKPTFSQVILMCLHIARAMHYLHTLDPVVIHRDLKSLNILLDQPLEGPRDQPLLKVADFGLARILDTNEGDSLTLGVGTNQWMAPEVMTGSSYDGKVDVYSFAVVTYEMTCQKIPFLHETPEALRRLIVAGERPDLSIMPGHYPKAMRELVSDCWATAPSERPAFQDIVETARVMWEGRGIVSL